MTYLINPYTKHRLGYCHVTDHGVTPAKSLSLKTVILIPFRAIWISLELTSHSWILPQHPIIFLFTRLVCVMFYPLASPILLISLLFVPSSIAAPFCCQQTTLFYPPIQCWTIIPKISSIQASCPILPFHPTIHY